MKTAKETRRAHFLALIAKYGRKEVQARLDCTPTYVSQLAGNAAQSRNIGDAKAREIETLFGLAPGSMDAGLSASAPIATIASESVTITPVESQLIQMFRALSPDAKGRVAAELTSAYYAQSIGEPQNPLEGTGALLLREAEKRGPTEKRPATAGQGTRVDAGKTVK